MNLTDEIEELDGLYQRGVLTDDEFAAAKQKLIFIDNAPEASVVKLEHDLRVANIQIGINAMDIDWRKQREPLMARALFGAFVPTNEAVSTRTIGGLAVGGLQVAFAVIVSGIAPSFSAFIFIYSGIIILAVLASANH